MSLPKTIGNADLRETKQIFYQSKGIDESYPKMYFLLNLSRYVKSAFRVKQLFNDIMDCLFPKRVVSNSMALW